LPAPYQTKGFGAGSFVGKLTVHRFIIYFRRDVKKNQARKEKPFGLLLVWCGESNFSDNKKMRKIPNCFEF